MTHFTDEEIWKRFVGCTQSPLEFIALSGQKQASVAVTQHLDQCEDTWMRGITGRERATVYRQMCRYIHRAQEEELNASAFQSIQKVLNETVTPMEKTILEEAGLI